MLEITAMINEMNIFLVAQVLIQSENAEILAWIFEQLNDIMFDKERFQSKVILINIALSFIAILKIMNKKRL